MKEKSTAAVSVIGGADGPTSIYIARRTGKMSLKDRIRNYIYKYKRKKAEKKIAYRTYSLHEVVDYAVERYNEEKYVQRFIG